MRGCRVAPSNDDRQSGTRLAVESIVNLLTAGWTHEEILDNYPHLRQEDIQGCLAYAADLLHSEHVIPLEAA